MAQPARLKSPRLVPTGERDLARFADALRAINRDMKPLDDGPLADIAALARTDGGIIVGDGTNFVLESGATALASLGIETGSYSPTVTVVSGVDTASGNTSRYVRIGTFVVVFFSINIDPTTTGAIAVDISLPVASTFAAASNAAGTAANQDGGAGRITANTTDMRAAMIGDAPLTNNRVWNGSFMYVIL